MTAHTIVSHEDWLAARRGLLAKEKEFLRLRDELSRQRRAIPWVRVAKPYTFEGATGPVTLDALFAGRSQLIVYHFMFAPDWDAGCRGCSFWADSFDRIVPHIVQRDVSLVAVSRAPYPKLAAFAQRFGWTFPWVSCGENEFNYDFGVSFRPGDDGATYNYAPYKGSMSDMPGFSVFARNDRGEIFHTYSTFARGLDPINPAYQLLDLVPKGRDEEALSHPMAWVKLRDMYDAAPAGGAA